MKFGQTLALSVIGAVTGGSGVFAQDSTTSAGAAASSNVAVANAMIPSGISQGCSAYLTGLDNDANFGSRVEPLFNITATFNPMTGLASDNVTTAAITSTLTSLCAASSTCPDSLVRSYLGQFYAACGAELTSSDASYSEKIREMYDYLYIVTPFRSAVCTRDGGSQKYCVLEIASLAASAGDSTNMTSDANNATLVDAIKVNSLAAATGMFAPVLQAAENLVIYTPISNLARRFLPQLSSRASGDAQVSMMTPNATTYRTTSLPYLFLQSDMSSNLLCAPCTKSVMSSYIAWEAQVPYALGLSSSPILGGQEDLWNGIGEVCGSNFTDAISVQAGVLASNSSSTAVMGAGEKLVVGQGLVSGVVLAIVGSVVAGWV